MTATLPPEVSAVRVCPERYTLRADCTLDPMNADMELDPAGEWVLYEDHARLVRDMAKLIAEMANALSEIARLYEDSADAPSIERAALFYDARCIARRVLNGEG